MNEESPGTWHGTYSEAITAQFTPAQAGMLARLHGTIRDHAVKNMLDHFEWEKKDKARKRKAIWHMCQGAVITTVIAAVCIAIGWFAADIF